MVYNKFSNVFQMYVNMMIKTHMFSQNLILIKFYVLKQYVKECCTHVDNDNVLPDI